MTCKFEWWDQQFPSAYCASVLTGGSLCRCSTVSGIKSDIHEKNIVIYLALTVSMAVGGLA